MKKRAKSLSGTNPKQGISGAKVFVYVFGIAATGGAIYMLYEYSKRWKVTNPTGEKSPIIPTLISLPTGKKTSSGSSGEGFPLKKGSKGAKVMELQKAVAKIIGDEAMKKFGGIDGSFGKGMESALKQAGLPIVIDEASFNSIVGSGNSGELKVVFDPLQIAKELYKQARAGNADEVLSVLKKITSVDQYTAVNKHYKKQSFIIDKTIVTDLLDFAFKDREGVQEQLRVEFKRIGLKNEMNSEKWTLSGFRLFNDIITLRNTYVEDMQKNKIPVRKGVILGDEIETRNGMTYFKAMDSTVGAVPTQDVQYVS